MRLGGFLVDPREIETYLVDMTDITEAQVVGVSTERGAAAVGFVIVEKGHEFDEYAIIDRCLNDLAKFKVPQRIVALSDFPKTEGPNGVKIQRDELKEMAQKALEKVKGE